MPLKICLAVIVLGLASCVSKPNGVSEKRIIASTGQPFDEAKYKQILADMQSTESEILTSYDGSDESEIEKDELAQDTQQGIENDVTPADEPVYTAGAEEQFIKNIGSETSVPELLAAAKKTISNTGTWAFKFIYIDKNGNEKILSQYNPHESLKPASTQKLFTGYLYLASGTESKSYSKNNLAAMLHVSHNEMADSALRRVAVQRGFNNDQMKNGLSFLKEFYGVLSDSSRYAPADGSGLSYANKVTVDVETSLLNRIYRGRYYSEFKMMLAHPSKQKCNYNTKRDQIGHRHPYHSTIGSRLNSLAGKVHAKTGTLNKTKALAGFVDVKDGGVIVFSVIGDYLKVGTGIAFAKINSVVEAHAKYTDSHIK
jgi:D-alanyl-D-alanine carboxypeptidase